jgi:hypothetical protein
MVLFLVSTPYHSRFSRGLLWIVAPVITALGFFAGAALFNRFRRLPRLPLSRLYFYPLLGCSIGAAVVFPFGPMLIVLGMCLLGSLSMLLFEFVAFRRLAGTTQNRGCETQARKNGAKARARLRAESPRCDSLG